MGDYITDIDGTIIRDFVRRTLHNLELIEQHAGSGDAYEFTQLINSLMGLLVFPKESFWNRIKSSSLDEIPAEYRPTTKKGEPKHLRDLVRLMRNSASHFNLVVEKDNKGIIRGVVMYNMRGRSKTWEAEFSVHQLRGFVQWFAEGIISSALLDTPLEEIA